MNKKNQNVYIPSIEGNKLYCHMFRDEDIESDLNEFSGMIPFSLELTKLKSLKDKESTKDKKKFKVYTRQGKEFSYDVINVKFNQKVKNGNELIAQLKKKVRKLNKDINALSTREYSTKLKKESCKNKIKDFVKLVEKEMKSEANKTKWSGLNNEKLRRYLYKNGFFITLPNGEVAQYRVYKRSGSKSRKGERLFVKESLYNEMISWSRMNLPFVENQKTDLASLSAYESLVGSSLESTEIINPKNILLVSDIESVFYKTANVIKKSDEEGNHLVSVKEKGRFENSVFDGQSLLQKEYFEDGVSMKLLRNFFFKSAAFSCDINQFLRDHCPVDQVYEEWELKDMLGNKVLAKDVHMITSPSSVKILKFSHILDVENKLSKVKQQKKMYRAWKKFIKDNGNIWGICKHEKKSKRGEDDQGNILQRLSYQMWNSIPMTKEDAVELTKWEVSYIQSLKGDDDFFANYLKDNANTMNCFKMFADLMERQKDIVNTEIFRDFRSREISSYQDKVKSGKVRLVGDYAVLLGNPIEFLYHSIGRLNEDLTIDVDGDVEVLSLNEVHTKLFPFDQEYIGFRNPHTYAGNILLMNNRENEFIDTYFDLSKNIVAVNTIRFELPSILSGADFDSDVVLIVNNAHLTGICKEFITVENGEYRNEYDVCLKEIPSDPNEYRLNYTDMAKVDHKLSQKFIGTVVNNGQFTLSSYHNLMNSDIPEGVDIKKLHEQVFISAILSEVSIDTAKKSFDLNIEDEIKEVETVNKEYGIPNKKPLFWKYVNEDIDEGRLEFYNCPMDILQDVIKTEYATDREPVQFKDLLSGGNFKNANYKQEGGIWEDVEKMSKSIKGVYRNKTIEKEDKNKLVVKQIDYFNHKIKKMKITPDTMYALLVHFVKDKHKKKLGTRFLKLLHETHPETFLNSFKTSKNT